MPRKSKVELSPHFEEIVDLLLQGESGRNISNYLKNQYNEEIGFNSINTYRRNHIKLEDKVIREVDRRLNEKTQKVASKKVDQIEHIEESTNAIVGATANQLEGLINVGANFGEDYISMKKAMVDPNSKVSEKDVADMSYKANRLYFDYIKHDESNVEVNVEVPEQKSIFEKLGEMEKLIEDINDSC